MNLREKILSKKAKIGIIGLGYVGLPEAVGLANVGFDVTGIDLSKEKIARVNRGDCYIEDIDKKEFKNAVNSKKLRATTDSSVIKNLDIVCVCVPTPFNIYKEPDLTCVRQATEQIAKNFGSKEKLVVLESTTYPGTTREIMLEAFSSSGRKVGRDFYLAFSPERIDPGNKKYYVTNTPKVVGGITKECTSLASLFYSQFVERTVPVSSPETAEMTKLLENIFRNVNIALMNELMLLCDRMKIDIWEVVDAAKTKPFGFMSFKPGPGVGGHCIPIDPVYLSWKAKEYDFHTRFIELAAEINSNMPYYVISRISRLLQRQGKPLNKSRVLLLGVAFKKDIDDVRNSPALKIIELLLKEGVKVVYNDPFIPKFKEDSIYMKSSKLTKQFINSCDCSVILTDHSCYDYKWIAKNSKMVLDTRNVAGRRANIERL